MEWLRDGVKHVCRGIVAHALYNVLELCREVTLELIFEEAIGPLVKRIKPYRKRARVKRLVTALRSMYVAAYHQHWL